MNPLESSKAGTCFDITMHMGSHDETTTYFETPQKSSHRPPLDMSQARVETFLSFLLGRTNDGKVVITVGLRGGGHFVGHLKGKQPPCRVLSHSRMVDWDANS